MFFLQKHRFNGAHSALEFGDLFVFVLNDLIFDGTHLTVMEMVLSLVNLTQESRGWHCHL
jgi:hypothetical protein